LEKGGGRGRRRRGIYRLGMGWGGRLMGMAKGGAVRW